MFVAAIASTLVGVMSAVNGANAREAAAKYNAKVARENAKMARYEGQIEINDKMREMRRTLGTARAAYGASGIDFSGSPIDVLADTASEYSWDIAKIGYRSEVRAVGQENQAKLDDMEADQAKKEKFLGAATEIFAGAGRILSYTNFGRDLGAA